MSASRRRFFAPEILQTSKMDCGPASLKCLLEGFGIEVGYGRLREACQTDVDGTSIDVIEDIAVQLGLDAQQLMVPEDHLFLPEAMALPVLIVLNVPGAGTHFVVVWRRHGAMLQVMDPGSGRRWVTRETLLRDLYRHTMRVPEAGLREWAGSPDFLLPLGRRLGELGLPVAARQRLMAFAACDATCQRLGALDAATRLVQHLVTSAALPRGGRLEALLARLSISTRRSGAVPESFWSFWPASDRTDDTVEEATDDAEPEALLRGAVLVTLRRPAPSGTSTSARELVTDLDPELRRALAEPTPSPWAALSAVVQRDGVSAPTVVAGSLLAGAAAVAAQAIALRGLLEVGHSLGTGTQRLGAMSSIVVLLVAILLVSGGVVAGTLRIGRRLEVRLRVALLEKIPRIGDQFFQSRLVSDMAERAHALAGLRALPKLAFGLLGTAFQLVFTVAGVVWQSPSSAPVVLAVIGLAVLFGWLSQPWMTERDLRVRGHNAALLRYAFDAFMGLWCIRAHGGRRAVMREQEAQVIEWSEAQLRLQRLAVLTESVQTMAGYALAVWLLARLRPGQEGSALLLAYWALQLPVLGQSLVALARQIPTQHNITERLLEPLTTPEEGSERAPPGTSLPLSVVTSCGPRVSIRDVTVRAGGRALFEHLSLEIEAGSHVAIVGQSGAGKSTLAGLLLGWHRPASGSVLVDGRPLAATSLAALRRVTAWIDPGVQLWNQRFIDNLTYAAGPAAPANEIGWAVDAAELRKVLERLPEGLQTVLGEGGALVSGGEGQRVRLARAMLQRNVRLAILDEPFRGLDRAQRTALMLRSRRMWRDATLLCVTHDVSETLQFDRVLVIEDGKVLEDGAPRVLAAMKGSHYRQLLTAEEHVATRLWGDGGWRRIRVERGAVTERASAVEARASHG